MSYHHESRSGFGEILKFRRDPIAFVSELSLRSLDIRSVRVGSRMIFQINHPDLIRDILVTHDWNFIKGRGLRAAKPVLGDGLLTSEGELHRRQRRLAQPSFHSARLANYAQTMVQCTAALSQSWQHDTDYPIDQEMMRLTLHIVGLTLFSADVLHDAKHIGQSLTRSLEVFADLTSPLAQILPPLLKLAEKRALRCRQEIGAILHKLIEEHRQHPQRYDDMLSMLMNAHDDSATGYMSDQLLLDECLTLFLAGHETTANALTWTWYLLAQHPEATRKLHTELDQVLTGRLPTLDDLPHLPYTSSVFKESLRLYPPAWIIPREAVTDYRLGTGPDSIAVPAGATLFLSPYAIQRDPRFWPNPNHFSPDRWLEDNSSRPKFAFFPFGAGTRNCIGEHFAMMEGILTLATIAQQWNLHLIPNQKIQLWAQLTLRPRNSIHFHLEKRSPS